ncbi:hypothetical protein [Psychroflexus lacisalsi]|uniref:Outer membrane porin, OprD family n=1 Tax=Psychroflexus lacisalsi TaxID=503928 RepID=A0ABN1K970_9FLAO|nr:hypothetical protein [Psychroflexus lacisalsi]MBZ9619799.1 hypothetical protein [Psychroflexus lacisalsi]
MKASAFLILFITCFALGNAQNESDQETQSQLKSYFKNAVINGRIRNFTMATYNQGSLQDYSTNATGGVINFKTLAFKGFQAGIQASFTYKTIGNELESIDPIVGRGDKWEFELYDVFNKGQFNHLVRLDELYLKYQVGNYYVSYGKIKTEYTRIINASDGRMNRFAHAGAWMHLNFDSPHSLDMGWLNRVSPRSSYDWFDFQDAFGLVNQGFQPNGDDANYRNFYPSKGIAVVNYGFVGNNLNFHFYNFLIDKISNISWFEADFTYQSYKIGIQYSHSRPLDYGDQLNYVNRYLQPDEEANVISSELIWFNSNWKIGVAYTHAMDTGRFLFPKEIGRDNFYTSIPRSRLEGLGGVDVFTFKIDYHSLSPNMKIGFNYQDLSGAEVGDFHFIKYNIDSTRQFNTQLTYSPKGFFKGLSFELLWVYIENKNEKQPELFFNRSNFHQLNFVTNFYF